MADFEILKVRYRKNLFPADDFKGILRMRNSDWPKKFKVWEIKRLSDGKVFKMYDDTEHGRITGFNTNNAYDEPYAYFEGCLSGRKLIEMS